MDVLQQASNEAMESLPSLFLEKMIAKRLSDQNECRSNCSISCELGLHILGMLS